MENKGYLLRDNVIILDKELTELDLFLRDFLDILTKYSDYLVVSGFVSISSGRARGTEDIDVLIPIMNIDEFKEMFEDLINNGFWCYQSENYKEVYELKNYNSVRFAKIGEMYPNIEFVPIDETKKAKYFEFTHPKLIRIRDFEFKIPPIEFEILYKEIILTEEKDIADARHLRGFFSDIINSNKLIEYEKIIEKELK